MTAGNTAAQDIVVDIEHVATHFGSHVVHKDVSLQVRRGEVFAVVGGSGSGKSTLLREMILLQRPDSGTLRLFGTPLADVGEDSAPALALRQRFGVLFQHGGLFGSLTVLENVGLPLREHTGLDDRAIDRLAAFKIALAGLPAEAAALHPSELSGGMLKRASLARALALDPELLFLDEPTAGLDPTGAAGVDELVCKLRDQLQLTVVMITHDIDLLWQAADRVAVLADGGVAGIGSMAELAKMPHPAIKQFFEGHRGRAAALQATENPPQTHDGQETAAAPAVGGRRQEAGVHTAAAAGS